MYTDHGSVLEDHGEVGWGLMMVLLWPRSWSKFIDLFFFLYNFNLIT